MVMVITIRLLPPTCLDTAGRTRGGGSRAQTTPASYSPSVDIDPRSTGDDPDVRSELRRYPPAEGGPAQIVAEYEKQGWLTSAGADAVLHGAREYTTEEAATRAGISPDAFEQAYQAAGFAIPSRDVKAWSDEDVTLMFAFGAAAELFGLAAMLQFARVLGASLARLAEASVANFLVNVEAPLRQTHPED